MGRRASRLASTAAALLLVATFGPAGAQTKATPPARHYQGVDLFDMPAFAAQEAALLRRAGAGDLATVKQTLPPLLARHGEVPSLHVVQAMLAAADGDADAAIAALARAIDYGFEGLYAVLTQPPLNRLAGDARITALEKRTPGAGARPPGPPPRIARVRNGVAEVTPENIDWDPKRRGLIARFQVPARTAKRPLYRGKVDLPLASLAVLVKNGLAAGNVGDFYDNRDGGHSSLPFNPKELTQLTHVRYGPEAQARQLHYSLNRGVLFGGATFGNSSTAVGGDHWRSVPRLALTTPDGMPNLWRSYANNQIYVFPEHLDHEPHANPPGRGDLFPAYTPYMIVTEGRSYSDKPVLKAIQAILAAFRPDVKARLLELKLIAPTVQMVLRSSLITAPGRDAYLSPLAHPTVFRGEQIDLSTAIGAANSIRIDTIPPMTRIVVEKEPRLRSGKSFFADGMSEGLFDSPAAVARLWRGIEPTRTYRLAAEAEDPNGRPLKFHWRVLRGDPKRIRIKPQDADRRTAEIVIPWHDPAPLPERPDVETSRVDIAVFADNGAQLSAPAIFSLHFPRHQKRVYEQGPRGLRVKSVAYDQVRGAYRDPLLWPARGWLDTYRYDAAGALLGWTRRFRGATTKFLPDGRRLDDGQPQKVRYPLVKKPPRLGVFAEETLAN